MCGRQLSDPAACGVQSWVCRLHTDAIGCCVQLVLLTGTSSHSQCCYCTIPLNPAAALGGGVQLAVDAAGIAAAAATRTRVKAGSSPVVAIAARASSRARHVLQLLLDAEVTLPLSLLLYILYHCSQKFIPLKDDDGYTALHHAVGTGFVATVLLLCCYCVCVYQRACMCVHEYACMVRLLWLYAVFIF
jgi:hypothetical protein